jgi:protein phosphatase-4 regulatory subunit 3
VQNLTVQEVSLYSHLVEVLCFFVRQHAYRSKFFLIKENLAARIAQLLACPEKHLKLTALKYFRTCIGLHDSFHNRQIIGNKLFEPILDIVFETMPRDNLLNSACLELFEFIKRENMKDLTLHLVEKYRDRLEEITYVDTFRQLIDKYEKYVAPPPENLSFTSVETEAPNRQIVVNGGQRWQGLKDADAEEDAYFNGPDDDDDDHFSSVLKPIANGASPLKPLVDYPDDDDNDDQMDILAQDTSPDQPRETIESPTPNGKQAIPPSERLPEKRRREEDEEDELAKLTTQPKRRSSISSVGSAVSTHGQTLRRKKSINSGKDGPPAKISIALAVKSGNASADAE